MNIRPTALALLGFTPVLACGPMEPLEDDATTLDTASTDEALVGGTSTSLRPEVGRFLNGRGGSCTATLIHERYVLTAAHCLDYPNYDNLAVPAGARFQTGSNSYSVAQIHSFGYDRYEYTMSTDRTTDVALLRLATAVPASVATPARIAPRMPRNNERVTIFGFGCTNRSPASGGGAKQYFEFNYGNDTQALCPGDSGGPVFLGNRNSGGELWGVNSDYAGSGSFPTWDDIFGDVTGLKTQIEGIIRQWEGGEDEPGFDRPGFDYRTMWITSNQLSDCRSACEKDSRCRAFTYRHPSATSRYGYCWLKDRIPGMVPKSGYTSGSMDAVASGLTFTTGGYRYFTPTPNNPEGCAAYCSTESACRSWRYSGNVCVLSNFNATLVDAAGASAGHKRQWTEENTDRWGADYRIFTTTSLLTCQNQCAREAKCAAFTHITNRCYLKTTEGWPSSYSGAVSGKKRGLDVNSDRPGSDYSSFTPSSPDHEHCQASCASQSRCKAWTYVPPSGSSGNPRCYLKTTIPGRYSSTGMFSGTRLSFGTATFWVDDPPNTDRNGSDYRTIGTTSQVTCKSYCQSDSSCRAWTFVSSRNRCYLKSTIPTAYNTTNMVSGIKGLEFAN